MYPHKATAESLLTSGECGSPFKAAFSSSKHIDNHPYCHCAAGSYGVSISITGHTDIYEHERL